MSDLINRLINRCGWNPKPVAKPAKDEGRSYHHPRNISLDQGYEPTPQQAPAVLKCNGEGCTLVHNGRGEHVPAAEYIEPQPDSASSAVPPEQPLVVLKNELYPKWIDAPGDFDFEWFLLHEIAALRDKLAEAERKLKWFNKRT